METEHLRVTFPVDLEDLGRRAADRAERAWAQLEARFVHGPSAKVDLLVTDHADISNGLTNVFPTNRIYIFAPPPLDGFSLSYMDEWLELVITHELVHSFHLDLTRGPSRVFRSVMGRFPVPWPSFPGSATPGWTVEGIAVYYESVLTGAGRVRGSFHEMVARTAFLEGAFESLNQVSGNAPTWPGGQRYYVYGSLFLDHLLRTYGEERMGAFADAVAGQWVPFRLDSAARDAFGISFSRAWKEWSDLLEERYGRLARELEGRHPLSRPERLTGEGQYALTPAVGPGGRVAFARYDARSDVQLRLLSPEGQDLGKVARTNSLANLAWTPDGDLLFSQIEYADRYRIRGDLYRATPHGEVTRLTRGLRLDHPHPLPGGGEAVAVQELGGTNRLVRVELESGRVDPLTPFDPLVHWAYPRVSPDGRWIAAARWSVGGFYDIVLLDLRGEVVAQVTRDRAVDISPAWSPDGRYLLWSSDRTGIPNLHAVEVDPVSGSPGRRRQVTNLLGGAAYPSVDPGARWIYLSGYHADGWHIERLPYRPGEWFDPFAGVDYGPPPADTARFLRGVQAQARGYNPLPTLRPTYWKPIFRPADKARGAQVLDPGYGISTSGQDLVGRHSYTLSAAFSGGPARFNGGVSYAYAGLGNPVLGAFLTQFYDAEGPLAAPDESGDLLYIAERERSLGLSLDLQRTRMRNVSTLGFSLSHVWEHRKLLDAGMTESRDFFLLRPDTRFLQGSAVTTFSNARIFPFSISPEDGVSFALRGSVRREAAVADSARGEAWGDRSYQEVVGQVSLYKGFRLPGFGNHVLALRGSGGVGRGPGADGSHFEVGGASGGGSPVGVLRFGESLLFPLRGYGTASRRGRNAWTATAEYRFPLRFFNTGPGLLPLHLDWLSGAFFLDAGNAWGPELDLMTHLSLREKTLVSVGGEITARLLPFWYADMEFRLGVGMPLVEGDGASVYLRLGPSF